MRRVIAVVSVVVSLAVPACSSGTNTAAASATRSRSSTASASETATATPTPTTTPDPNEKLADPQFTKSCPRSEAVDLTDEDPWVMTAENKHFTPDCFVARRSASLEIVNNDPFGHTFRINGTVVNAPLIYNQTYTHGPSTSWLETGAYRFHCTIHPEMTGTLILV